MAKAFCCKDTKQNNARMAAIQVALRRERDNNVFSIANTLMNEVSNLDVRQQGNAAGIYFLFLLF